MRFFILLLMLFLAVSAHAQESKDRSYFFTCGQDSDCIVVEGACPGFSAIHKKYRDEAAEFWKSIMPHIECSHSVPMHPASYYAAFCNAKRTCELKKK